MAPLALAPLAQAAKGVVGHIPVPKAGSGTPEAGAIAVSLSGAGGVDAGDIYTVDALDNRVLQLAPSGELIRVWGQDVIVNTGAPPNSNGTGFEICDMTAGNVPADCKRGLTNAQTGGALSQPAGIALNQTTGHVYVSDTAFRRVQEFDATGHFIRAWGQDVVSSGPGDDPPASAVQTLTIPATVTGGTFDLTLEGQTAAGIAFDATAANLQSALVALDSIGPGNVEVTGGPGGSAPFTITFVGALANAPIPALEVDSTDLTGDSAEVAVDSAGSTGFEICTAPADTCKAGIAATTAGGFVGGSGGGSTLSLAVAPAGAPDEGDVIVGDATGNRIQQFTASGEFVRAWGWDVTKAGAPGNEPRNERQEVTIAGGAGTFTLGWRPPGSSTQDVTAPIPFDAPPPVVEAALAELDLVAPGDVSVSGGPGDPDGTSPYLIEFTGGLADRDVPELEVDTDALHNFPGRVFTCDGDSDSDSPNGVPEINDYQWLRNGEPIPGATEAAYTTVAADVGTAVQCSVEVESEGPVFRVYSARTLTVSFPPIQVLPVSGQLPEAPPDPNGNSLGDYQIGAPSTPNGTINWNGLGGETLTCPADATEWGGSPTLSYRWLRNTEVVAVTSGPTYTLSAGDVEETRVSGTPTGAAFQCLVIGTNSNGSVAAVSRAYSPNRSSTTGSIDVSSDLGSVSTTAQGSHFETCAIATCKAGEGGPLIGQLRNLTSVAADSSGAFYAVETTFSRVQKFVPQPGLPAISPSLFGKPGAPNGLQGSLDSPRLVAVGAAGQMLFAKEERANTPPNCLDGTASPNEQRIQEISGDGEVLLGTYLSCADIDGPGGLAAAPGDDPIYLSATHTLGSFSPVERRIYILAEALDPAASLDPPTPNGLGANLSGSVEPNPGAYPNPTHTSWQIEYRQAGLSDWTPFGAPRDAGAGTAPVPFRTTVIGLRPSTSYEFRVVLTKQFDSVRTSTAPVSFTTTPARPAIEGVSSSDVTASSANLNARIDPRGGATSYHFEYGPTAALGQTTPEVGIGDGQGGQDASAHITGIGDTTHYFQVIATNPSGTVVSPVQTFDFHPPSCPNAQVRQQTGASYLPDCRAYEIASAEDAGGSVLFPGTAPTAGEATSPSRVAYTAAFGSIPGTGDPINTRGDLYVATRESDGWVTRYVGLPAEATHYMGPRPGPEAKSLYSSEAGRAQSDVLTDPKMERLVNWDNGNPYLTPNPFDSNAPFVWNADGGFIERWPTNLDSVSGGDKFIGVLRASEDLSNFAFSSDIPFAPGGVPGDVYDNDTVSGSVEIISRDAADNPIQAEPLALSADGSRILMSTAKSPYCPDRCPPPPLPTGKLYMRVGETSYDVSANQDVRFAGMTSDGSTVYMTTDTPLTADDHDTGVDLFEWSEDAPTELTRISAGSAGGGDTDECLPVSDWTSGCGVRPISELGMNCSPYSNSCDSYPRFFSQYSQLQGGSGGNGISDSFLASGNGDIYFYSPEQLVGPDLGAYGQQNLYLYRDGQVRFVAALAPGAICVPVVGSNSEVCSEGPIARMQVSPNGRYAAFISNSRLTAGDNGGFAAMYRYDSVDDDLRCVSCPPDGGPQRGPVMGSLNGLYLTDDGRVFFSSEEALISRDTNDASDVYEYVAGRAQLISPGTGARQESVGGFLAAQSIEGLVGVSADGTDAYFATYDVLSALDRNGGELKIYDARTNGGFPLPEPQPGCVAADECHGQTSAPPRVPDAATVAPLGDRGNARPSRRRCGKRPRRGRKAAKRARKRGCAKRRAKKRRSRSMHRRSSRRAEQ